MKQARRIGRHPRLTPERAQPHDPAQLRRWVGYALSKYLFNHPDDAGRMTPIREALERGQDLGSRKTMPLHLTGSAVAIEPATRRVLMVEHAFLGRWLQPGGHLDRGELPARAAAREMLEESGVTGTAVAFPGGAVDIDVHAIPENPAKGEPAHLHADFAYVFSASGDPVATAESASVAWREREFYAGCDARSARIAARLAARSR